MPDLVDPIIRSGTLGPQPFLAARGLELRPWETGDALTLVAAYGDPDIRFWHARTMTLAEAEDWVRQRTARWTAEQGADWAVCDAAEVVGRAGLRIMDLAAGQAEIAYWVLPVARGEGVAGRAVQTLAEWAFGAGFQRLTLMHSTRNPASCRVAEKLGFALEGTLRRDTLHPDGWHDMHLHARLRAPGDAAHAAVDEPQL